MSHFTVMILGENADKQLAPFDENLELPLYVEFTKEQLIDNKRKEIENYKNTYYAQFMSDKEAYKAKCNDNHIRYLENEFPLKLEWNEEQLYEDAIQFYASDKIGENGEVYSTCNPKSKWDWYQIGGRWAGLLKLKDGVKPVQPLNFSWGWDEKEQKERTAENRADVAYKKDIANIDEIVCFALIKDGVWYERGQMGWWGIVTDGKEQDAWDEEFKKLIKNTPDDTLISIYDCHI